MINRKIVCLLLALVLLTSCGQKVPSSLTPSSAATVSAASIPAPSKIIWRSIPAPALTGNLIGEPLVQDIGICLPAGYSQGEKAYPVLYYLTGFTEDYKARTQAFLAALQQSGAETLVVVINGYNRFGGSWYANSPVTGHWEDYVVADVTGYVDSHFSTRATAEGRGLVGHSMGGAGVLSISMQRPGVFSFAYAMSPAVFRNEDFDKTGLDFAILHLVAENYSAMNPQQAALAYPEDIGNLPASFYWTLGYASAFAPQPEGLPPFVHTEREAYLSGAGNLTDRIQTFRQPLSELHTLAIDYGSQDENGWIAAGCEELGRQLESQGVPHTLAPYKGDHNNQITIRLEQVVIPQFIQFAERA